jgi:putative ATPase
MLPEINRPIVLVDAHNLMVEPEIQFDRILGRNVLLHEPDKAALIQKLAKLLRSNGRIVLAETLSYETQRLYELVDARQLPQGNRNQVESDVWQRWIEAEEAIYQDGADPMVNWREADLLAWFAAAGLQLTLQREVSQTDLHVTDDLLDRWFRPGQTRPSYVDRLARSLSPQEQSLIQQLLTQTLKNQTVQWRSAIVFVQASF